MTESCALQKITLKNKKEITAVNTFIQLGENAEMKIPKLESMFMPLSGQPVDNS